MRSEVYQLGVRGVQPRRRHPCPSAIPLSTELGQTKAHSAQTGGTQILTVLKKERKDRNPKKRNPPKLVPKPELKRVLFASKKKEIP